MFLPRRFKLKSIKNAGEENALKIYIRQKVQVHDMHLTEEGRKLNTSLKQES